jgi:hypothetical protein
VCGARHCVRSAPRHRLGLRAQWACSINGRRTKTPSCEWPSFRFRVCLLITLIHRHCDLHRRCDGCKRSFHVRSDKRRFSQSRAALTSLFSSPVFPLAPLSQVLGPACPPCKQVVEVPGVRRQAGNPQPISWHARTRSTVVALVANVHGPRPQHQCFDNNPNDPNSAPVLLVR